MALLITTLATGCIKNSYGPRHFCEAKFKSNRENIERSAAIKFIAFDDNGLEKYRHIDEVQDAFSGKQDCAGVVLLRLCSICSVVNMVWSCL
jgi:hypothetical protein